MPPDDIFLERQDISQCDREPIHTPNAVQPFAALLVICPKSWHIVQASENLETMVGTSWRRIVGQPLASLLGAGKVEQLRAAQAAGQLHRLSPLRYTLNERDVACFAEEHDGLFFIEIEAWQDPRQVEGYWVDGRLPLEYFRKMGTTMELCQDVAREVHERSGFDRTMVYRFDEDWHGEVIVELKRPEVEGCYLGHHFPASDIPAPARALYSRLHFRAIPDVSVTPSALQPSRIAGRERATDLSFCQGRAVSPVHLEYLRNMNVAASMTLSIMLDNRLWGMITCHHQSPRHVPHAIRRQCAEMGEFLSAHITQLERLTVDAQRRQRGQDLALVMQDLQDATGIAQGLQRSYLPLLRMLDADGLCIRFGGQGFCIGAAPKDNELTLLSQRARQDGWLVSSHLASVHPMFAALSETVAGAIVLPLPGADEFIAAFRREQIATRNWAGNPYKLPSENGRLHPRKSFDVWTETVRGQSRRWTALDQSMLRELARSLMERRDYLARLSAEAQLKGSEERFRLIFERAAEGIVLVSRDGLVLQANEAFARIVGYSQEELQKMRLKDLTHPEDHPGDQIRLQELLFGKKPYASWEKRYIRKDGSIIWGSVTVSVFQPQATDAPCLLGIVEDITKRVRAEEHARYLATHDVLTGLYSRAYFNDALPGLLQKSHDQQEKLALMVLDLDRFKAVNDTYGHLAGDALLQQVAQRIQQVLPATGLAVRLGGDEFVVVLPAIVSQEQVLSVAQALIKRLGESYFVDGNCIETGTSIGIALYPDHGDTVDLLFGRADTALYMAKRGGRGTYRIYRKGD